MKAAAGKRYAMMADDKVYQIFGKDDLPEWHDDLDVLDVTDIDCDVGYEMIDDVIRKPRPSEHHNWHANSKEWLIDDEKLAQADKDEAQAAAEAAAESVRAALQSAIDLKAQSMGYKDGNSLMLYAGFENPFQAQALIFSQWEAQVWVDAMTYKELVVTGKMPMLSGDESVAMMPAYPKSEAA